MQYLSELNIKSSFSRSAILPLESTKLLRVPLPAAAANLSSEDAVLLSSSYVDNISGAVMNSPREMQLAADRAKHDKALRA
eukprot:IDg16440t1